MEDKKKFIINTVYYAIVLFIVYLVYKYFLSIFGPFVIGFVLAYLALLISKKIFKEKNNRFFKSLSLALIYILIVILITLIGLFVTGSFTSFAQSLPSLYKNYLVPAINSIEKALNNLNRTMPSDINNLLSQSVDGLSSSLSSLISSFSSTLVSVLTSIITYTPTLIIEIIVCIISSFYFLFDFDSVINYVKSIMSKKVEKEFESIKLFITKKVFKMIISYGIIMFITFVELLIGFSILKIDNYFVLALVICVVDILPVLGVGTVLIPWGLIDLILGETFMGIGILVLYIIISVIRNIVEPKLMGMNLGLHPLAALITMIVGMNLCGIIGLFIFPLLCSYMLIRDKLITENE